MTEFVPPIEYVDPDFFMSSGSFIERLYNVFISIFSWLPGPMYTFLGACLLFLIGLAVWRLIF